MSKNLSIYISKEITSRGANVIQAIHKLNWSNSFLILHLLQRSDKRVKRECGDSHHPSTLALASLQFLVWEGWRGKFRNFHLTLTTTHSILKSMGQGAKIEILQAADKLFIVYPGTREITTGGLMDPLSLLQDRSHFTVENSE